MTTLIYSKGSIYSDTHISSKHIDQRSIQELENKRNEAMLSGQAFETLLLDCQLASPFLGVEGSNEWVKQHGKFYWFKYPHYLSHYPLYAVGIAGNMLGYSLFNALDIYAVENEIEIPTEMRLIRQSWIDSVGEEADFECFFLTEGGIIVEDKEGDFFFVSQGSFESFVFGSGRAHLHQRGELGENIAYQRQGVETFYGVNLKPKDIMTRVQGDPDTNNEWVTFSL